MLPKAAILKQKVYLFLVWFSQTEKGEHMKCLSYKSPWFSKEIHINSTNICWMTTLNWHYSELINWMDIVFPFTAFTAVYIQLEGIDNIELSLVIQIPRPSMDTRSPLWIKSLHPWSQIWDPEGRLNCFWKKHCVYEDPCGLNACCSRPICTCT